MPDPYWPLYNIRERKEQITCPFPNSEEKRLAFLRASSGRNFVYLMSFMFLKFLLIPLILHRLKAQPLPTYTFVLPCSSVMTVRSIAMESDQFLFPLFSVWEVIILN